MKKLTAYAWAFIVALVVFLTAGLFTLGSTDTYGKSLTVVKNQTVYYELSSSQTLEAVYVNVGAVHTEVGEKATITIKTSTSTTTPSKATWSTLATVSSIGNLAGEDGAQYNWVALTKGNSKSMRKISFTSNVNLELNEIVCLNTNGERMALTPNTTATVYGDAEAARTLDAQDTFMQYVTDGKVVLNNNAYANFSQEEGYYMSAVQNILSGNDMYADSVYTVDQNFNYLATLLMTPSVAIFGNSVFALRFPAFMATCLLLVFAFLLLRELTKSDRCAFYFSLVLALGGVLTTVGRFGAPYAMIVSALIASLYFMYRFFAHGISSRNILRGSMNIFVSGLFAAVAMAMDITAAIPVAGILVLFGFGLRRQKLAYNTALAKTAGKEETVTDENGEAVVVNKAADKAREDYRMKTRVSYGFAALSFVMGTAILLLLAGVLAYSACVRAYGDVSFLSVVWKGIAASAHDSGLMANSATNASNVLAWWLPIKPATLYTGVTDAASGSYLAWSVLPNVVATVGAAIAFLGVTVKVVWDIVAKNGGKNNLRLRRAYIVLLGGMVAAMLAGWARGNVSALSGMLFHVAYLGFLPLAATLLPAAETKTEKALINVALSAVVAVVAVAFILGLPATYGYVVTASRANWFGWMSIFSNGFFRI